MVLKPVYLQVQKMYGTRYQYTALSSTVGRTGILGKRERKVGVENSNRIFESKIRRDPES